MTTEALRRRIATLAIASIAAASLTGWADTEHAIAAPLGVQRAQFTSGSSYLVIEVLDDDLVHFEVAGSGAPPGTLTAMFTTPQIAKTDYPGPQTYSISGNTIQTAELQLNIDDATLCVTATDITRTPDLVLQTTCPVDLTQAWKGLDITKSSMENAYGLGQQFFTGASADGDWVGRVRSPGGTYGNAMVYDAENGPVGNTQIPVLFAVGDMNANYGLFVDQLYKQEWNLTGDPWTMRTWGDQVRWYLMSGPNLPDLRKDYMELTGTPSVPPRKAFGLWVSEFGYDNWSELDDTIANLRAADFPVDGAMLDVQWFGGVTANSDSTRMGTLDWDTAKFPNAASKIAALKTDGVGIIPPTGTGFVDGFASSGDAVEFDVWTDGTATHQLRFRYSNGATASAVRTVRVDGTNVGTLILPTTGSWSNWGTASIGVSLTPGRHTVRIEYANDSSGGINLDSLVLTR